MHSVNNIYSLNVVYTDTHKDVSYNDLSYNQLVAKTAEIRENYDLIPMFVFGGATNNDLFAWAVKRGDKN